MHIYKHTKGTSSKLAFYLNPMDFNCIYPMNITFNSFSIDRFSMLKKCWKNRKSVRAYADTLSFFTDPIVWMFFIWFAICVHGTIVTHSMKKRLHLSIGIQRTLVEGSFYRGKMFPLTISSDLAICCVSSSWKASIKSFIIHTSFFLFDIIIRQRRRVSTVVNAQLVNIKVWSGYKLYCVFISLIFSRKDYVFFFNSKWEDYGNIENLLKKRYVIYFCDQDFYRLSNF